MVPWTTGPVRGHECGRTTSNSSRIHFDCNLNQTGETRSNTVEFYINMTDFIQTRRIFITFQTSRTKKKDPNINLSRGGGAPHPSPCRPTSAVSISTGDETDEVKVRSLARKSRTQETDWLTWDTNTRHRRLPWPTHHRRIKAMPISSTGDEGAVQRPSSHVDFAPLVFVFVFIG